MKKFEGTYVVAVTPFDKSGELEKTTYVMINQVPIFGDKLTRALKEGDEVTFLYASQEP